MVAVVLVLVVVELAAAVAWSVQQGRIFTPAAAAAWRAQAAGATPEAAARAAAQGAVTLHPYLGYVLDQGAGAIAGLPISSWGLLDGEPLRGRGDDTWVVALLGGSVALQLGIYGGEQLAQALGRSAALAGKRVEIVRLGLGGWKQPQPLFALQLLLLHGARFDCVVNLDGFNEVALVGENVPHGVPAWFPRGWRRLLDAVPAPDQQRRLALLVLLEEQRRSWLEVAARWPWSPTAQLLASTQERRLAARLGTLRAEAEHAAAEPSFAVTGPGTGGASLDAARAGMVELWERASAALHAACTAQGIPYFHFLQPNQYVPDAKPIGPEEARVALAPDHDYAAAVRDGYPQLQAAGARLRARGVAFTDLTGIFREHPEPLYVDTCCHLGRAGNAILAEHVAAAVRAGLELRGFAARTLRVEPAVLRLDSPFATAPLRVVGVGADGREADLTGSALGTSVEVVPADAVVVGSDGSVRALRRGEHRLRVRHGEAHRDVLVTAAWPDVCASDAPDGAPRLEVVADDGAAGLTVACVGLPEDGIRVLARAASPLPATPPAGFEAFGVDVTTLPGAGVVLRTSVPGRLPPGRPLFLRGYTVGASGAVIASTNALAITRG